MTIKLIAIAALAAGGGWLGYQATAIAPPTTPTKMNSDTKHVGTKPGDIGTSKDIHQTAKSRGHDLVVYAAGCFWGVEQKFRKTPGVIATAVGYIGGHKDNPTYREVCTKTTGHAEGVLVEFDPKVISLEALTEKYFEFHDPTQVNRQGPDIGTNYRSHIFTYGDDQVKVVQAVKDRLNAGKFGGKIATQISPAPTFWMAEDYHQQYNEKNGIDACPSF